MSGNSDFALAWNDYHRRRRWFFGVWLGGFAILVTLDMLLSKLPLRGLVFDVLGPIWMIGFVIVAIRLSLFRCPRCHHRFFTTWWHGNPLARKCLHCGLPKWSEVDLHEKQKV